MKPFATLFIAAWTIGAAVFALAQSTAPKAPPALPPGPDPDSQYRLGPDSMPQPGVPQGQIRGPFTLPCNVYPGT